MSRTGADPVGSGQSLIPGRLVSLDAFRGITIAGMILVNNPGSWSYVYAPLRHAEWHGWTPTDLIFPFFLFIVGVSMTLSFAKQREKGLSERDLRLKVLKRALLIFALGLFLHAFRIFGVLQRIALAYLFASLITLRSGPTGQIRWAGGLLLFYWVVMKAVPVPGFGVGDLSMEGNLAAWLDRTLFGEHLWRDLYDPEGLLSTIPAVATVLLGVLTGRLIHSDRDRVDITNRLFVWGWGAILAGLIVSIWFPINKALWTSSYVLFTAGAAMQFESAGHLRRIGTAGENPHPHQGGRSGRRSYLALCLALPGCLRASGRTDERLTPLRARECAVLAHGRGRTLQETHLHQDIIKTPENPGEPS